MSRTAGVYMLLPKHAAALDLFRGDPALAEHLRNGGADLVARETAGREAGASFAFAIEDKGAVVGLCRLGGIGKGAAREVAVYVAPASRRKGYATFAVGMLLDLAFRNLQLEEVRTRAADEAVARVLARCGLRRDAGEHAVTKERWREALDAPALGRLHPALRRILDAERAAGNEVAESSLDWPEPGSVLVRLKHPFRMAHEVPAGVTYAEPKDPHWWKAEYSAGSPRHVLAH